MPYLKTPIIYSDSDHAFKKTWQIQLQNLGYLLEPLVENGENVVVVRKGKAKVEIFPPTPDEDNFMLFVTAIFPWSENVKLGWEIHQLFCAHTGDRKTRIPYDEKTRDLIRQVLLKQWDPIGVDGLAPSDEYDSYIHGIFLLLDKGASAEEIADCLHQIETKAMGLSDGIFPHSRNMEVAHALLSLPFDTSKVAET